MHERKREWPTASAFPQQSSLREIREVWKLPLQNSLQGAKNLIDLDFQATSFRLTSYLASVKRKTQTNLKTNSIPQTHYFSCCAWVCLHKHPSSDLSSQTQTETCSTETMWRLPPLRTSAVRRWWHLFNIHQTITEVSPFICVCQNTFSNSQIWKCSKRLNSGCLDACCKKCSAVCHLSGIWSVLCCWHVNRTADGIQIQDLSRSSCSKHTVSFKQLFSGYAGCCTTHARLPR